MSTPSLQKKRKKELTVKKSTRILAVDSITFLVFCLCSPIVNVVVEKMDSPKKAIKRWDNESSTSKCTARLTSIEVLFQNTQEIKKTLFNWMKQDKTCKSSRKSSFSSYVQHKHRKTNNEFNLSSVSWMWEAGGRKRARD